MQTFLYPDEYESAHSWRTFRLPILFDPVRAFYVLLLVWFGGVIAAVMLKLFLETSVTEGVVATILSIPVMLALLAVHILDGIRNPIAARFARTHDGRELLDRGTGVRLNIEQLLKYEQTWGKYHAERGDDRNYEQVRWAIALQHEQRVLGAQRLFLQQVKQPVPTL